MRNLLKTLSLVCLLCASQTADAQFNTVGTSRKVAAVQSTGRLRADHVTVTVEGEVIEPVRKDTLAAHTLSNINHQNSGVTKPVHPPVQQLGSASAPIDSTRTEPRHLLCTPLKQLTVSSPFGMRKDPFTGKPTLYLYDSVTGGIGLADKAYDMMPVLLQRAKETIETCSCAHGCPSCIGSQSENGKRDAVELLRRMIDEQFA